MERNRKTGERKGEGETEGGKKEGGREEAREGRKEGEALPLCRNRPLGALSPGRPVSSQPQVTSREWRPLSVEGDLKGQMGQETAGWPAMARAPRTRRNSWHSLQKQGARSETQTQVGGLRGRTNGCRGLWHCWGLGSSGSWSMMSPRSEDMCGSQLGLRLGLGLMLGSRLRLGEPGLCHPGNLVKQPPPW